MGTVTPSRNRPGVGRLASPHAAKFTGSLDAFRRQHLLVIADAQNLELGARDLGYRLDWQSLAERLSTATSQLSLHAVIAIEQDDDQTPGVYEKSGWQPEIHTIRRLRKKRATNIDHYLLFRAGHLCDAVPSDWVLVGTGDGDLAEAVAMGIRNRHPTCSIGTLSLAGSTAQRLNVRTSPLFDLNVEIGQDCLIAR